MIVGPVCKDVMKLQTLVKALQQEPRLTPASAGAEVTGLAYDSRQVKRGSLFVAIHGRHHDGSQFIEDALERGAVAVVGEGALSLRQVPYIEVPDARRALADMACAFYDHPADPLEVYGVTGTNGKTTVAFMIRAILKGEGGGPGLISTVRYEIGERVIPAGRTTPEAPDLQSLLHKMKAAGCRHAIMEVSSHALDQSRVRGIDFDVALFTNLTHDHLDYHGTMERYFEAKRRLFRTLGLGRKPAVAVINADDPYGRRLEEDSWASTVTVLTYGLAEGVVVRATDLELDAEGARCTVHTPWGTAPLRLPLLGRFNILNSLAAIAACGARGHELPAMIARLEHMEPVPGRLESVAEGQPFNVFVDYAHTDDALRTVLEILAEITAGRIWLVFGCGGDRDRGKRAAMGAVADRWAYHTLITSDNPRHEDPADIAAEIAAGFTAPGRYAVHLDREEAIRHAIDRARPGDTVLIAGKGHEKYQEFKQTVIPFDDAEIARRKLAEG
jgi:UDP-N-acetylmuramoyl-L-alanyl-D-glutamate--2,6-diaminopimelate ligase